MLVEQKLRDYLKTHLKIPVYLERPENPPETYALIERTGGTERNYVSSATFAVKSIAGTMYQAAKLDGDVVRCLRGFSEVDNITSCMVEAHYNFTDTTTRVYRYQATVAVQYMEDE